MRLALCALALALLGDARAADASPDYEAEMTAYREELLATSLAEGAVKVYDGRLRRIYERAAQDPDPLSVWVMLGRRMIGDVSGRAARLETSCEAGRIQGPPPGTDKALAASRRFLRYLKTHPWPKRFELEATRSFQTYFNQVEAVKHWDRLSRCRPAR